MPIDLNADLGESYGRWTLGDDAALMPHLTSVNVAAGFHGGDPYVLRRTVELAVEHGVGIGGPLCEAVASLGVALLMPPISPPPRRPRASASSRRATSTSTTTSRAS